MGGKESGKSSEGLTESLDHCFVLRGAFPAWNLGCHEARQRLEKRINRDNLKLITSHHIIYVVVSKEVDTGRGCLTVARTSISKDGEIARGKAKTKLTKLNRYSDFRLQGNICFVVTDSTVGGCGYNHLPAK
jgi:hypothetical protein